MPVPHAFCMILLVALSACSGDASDRTSVLRLDQVLGGNDIAGYLRAEAPRRFSFPGDHGLHPGFRNEWWYLTGNLSDAEGRRFGYQVTFFTAARPPDGTAPLVSAWSSERLWMAHVGVSDIAAGTHRAYERFSRENPGLAGARMAPFRVWLEDWQLAAAEGNDLPWQLQVATDDLELSLSLSALKPPVLQGDAGLSRKSPEPGNASYYYSLTRLETSGSLTIGTEQYRVDGLSWLDREWSTSALAPDQAGWDWFSLQFDDGQELMYYQLRMTTGAAHPNSRGSWTDAQARQTAIRPEDLTLREVEHWTSPDGTRYPIVWELTWRGTTWQVRALLAAQWMDLSLPYWEGAVAVLDTTGNRVGRGYLEMVRQ